MTNHPEQQQINSYIKWLIYSAPGAVALVPCTTYAWADWLMWGTVDTIAATFGRSGYWKVNTNNRNVEIVGRGRLYFMVLRPEKMFGRLWDRVFGETGPDTRSRISLELDREFELAKSREEK